MQDSEKAPSVSGREIPAPSFISVRCTRPLSFGSLAHPAIQSSQTRLRPARGEPGMQARMDVKDLLGYISPRECLEAIVTSTAAAGDHCSMPRFPPSATACVGAHTLRACFPPWIGGKSLAHCFTRRLSQLPASSGSSSTRSAAEASGSAPPLRLGVHLDRLPQSPARRPPPGPSRVVRLPSRRARRCRPSLREGKTNRSLAA